jgi:Flp pilus assembly secretin CpaC
MPHSRPRRARGAVESLRVCSVRILSGRVLKKTLGACAIVACTVVGAASAHAGEMIDIVLDRATVMRIPEKVATIVVGNPLIADASLQPGGIMVLTGKGFGTTNVLALDRSGTVLMDRSVQVTSPRSDVLVVHRGLQQESYSCNPHCERRITLGDSKDYFDTALSQTVTRTGSAQGGK